MNILDESPKYVMTTTTYEPMIPLIPLPTEYQTEMEGVYVCKPDELKWDSFVDSKDWTPKKYHDRLLKARAFHSRMAAEYVMMLGITDEAWVSRPSLELLIRVAIFSLRRSEYELLSYQITCGMVVLVKKNNGDCIYKFSKLLYGIFLKFTRWGIKKMGSSEKTSNEMMIKLIEGRPTIGQSIQELCVVIDKTLHCIVLYMKETMGNEEELMIETEAGLRESISMFNKIIRVL